MKKVFNWLGLIANSFYVICIIGAKLLGDKMQTSGNIQIRNIFYALATIMTIAAFALIPAIWDRTLGVLLPLKYASVILIDKSIENRYIRHGAKKHIATKFFLTFKFNNGERKVFCVNSSAYESKVFFQYYHMNPEICVIKSRGTICILLALHLTAPDDQ